MGHTEETKRKISEAISEKWQDKNYRQKNLKSILKSNRSIEKRKKLSKATKKSWKRGKYNNRNWNNSYRLSYLLSIKEKYPTFCKIEEPKIDLKNLTIKVKCKTCNKLFKPSYTQLYERIRAIEKDVGFAENNFYCTDKCKTSCSVYRKRTDGINTKSYTQEEYEIFRQFVLERDNYKCQYCGDLATIVHHERPQKLEPFFSLDPDFAWSCCEKCHYEKGHPVGTECSTGNLSNRICK